MILVSSVCLSRYHTITLPEDEAANCLFVNGSLLHTHSVEIPLSAQVSYCNLDPEKFIKLYFQVFKEKINFPQKEIALSEFSKTGRGLSSLCLLVRKTKNIRKL